MDSITKNRQRPEALRAMIARAYGADQVPTRAGFATELGGGLVNAVYRVRLRDGREVVLKVAPPASLEVMAADKGAVRNELAALALLRDHPQVPVPVVDHADLSHEIVDADWFTMELLPGTSLDAAANGRALHAAEVDALGRQLGALNRLINEVPGDSFGMLGGARFPTWREAFGAMWEDMLADGERAGIDIGVDYARLRALLARDVEALDEVEHPRLVEWDLWPGNVMVADGRIVRLIDHERAMYGDPLIEAGFNGIDIPSLGSPLAFIAGYGLGQLSKGERRRRFLYSVYLALHMIIETRFRVYPDDHQCTWATGVLHTLVARTEADLGRPLGPRPVSCDDARSRHG